MTLTPPASPLDAIALQASLEEIDAELRRRGHFRYSHEYVKDLDFRRRVLEPQLSTMDQVFGLLQKLDNDHKAQDPKSGSTCTKVYSVLQSLKLVPNFLTDVEWALSSLARARRTCCGCHQTGSFHPRKN